MDFICFSILIFLSSIFRIKFYFKLFDMFHSITMAWIWTSLLLINLGIQIVGSFIISKSADCFVISLLQKVLKCPLKSKSLSLMQALLVRTINDYTKAGHDCQSSSLEIRLVQSQDDIRNPEIKYKAELYNWDRLCWGDRVNNTIAL